MFFGILTLLVALSISAIAIYYSVAGLVAIFAAAAVPIMIMGGALEIGKLVTAVWLHKYWRKARWWMRFYLSVAMLVLMFITSMGIFGFLSKAHIEQTASAQEGVAQIERIETEIARQTAVIARAEERLADAESSINRNNEQIQEQIDREQARIDSAYERIQPAIQEQTAIIEDARTADDARLAPYNEQLASLDAELIRLEEQVQQYEDRIANLSVDSSVTQPVIDQITTIEESISLVQGQLAGRERDAIRAAQRIIGVNDDGSVGNNTRRAANAWIEQQEQRIAQLREQLTELRQRESEVVASERERLAGLIDAIKSDRIPALKERQLEILATIDQVRAIEPPAIIAARSEIARLRESADLQVAQSQSLIQSLRESITIGEDQDVAAAIEEQQQRIIDASQLIDSLTEQRYVLEAQYRALEAEVGPVKYLAEFVYNGEADRNTLEDAVRWVIIIIIFVFDPLAVALLIASQFIFDWRREEKEKNKSTQIPVIEPVETNIIEPTEVIVTQEETTQETQQMSDVIIPEPDNKKVDTKVYDPYTDTRPTKELSVTERSIREDIWPDGYDGKLAPPRPFKEE
jgi:flagellar basal body-associated protein FliL